PRRGVAEPLPGQHRHRDELLRRRGLPRYPAQRPASVSEGRPVRGRPRVHRPTRRTGCGSAHRGLTMRDVLTGHIGELAALWLVLMAVVGGVTALVMIRMPGRRHQIPLLVPLVIGVFGLTATGVGAARSGWDEVGHALTGAPVVGDLLGIGSVVPLLVVVGVAVALVGSWASFRLEVALLRLRRRRR